MEKYINVCSQELVHCREVKQHWNSSQTSKFSETKNCLPCHLLNSGISFHPGW